MGRYKVNMSRRGCDGGRKKGVIDSRRGVFVQ